MEIPSRLIDVLARHCYARSMRNRPYEAVWDDLNREKRKPWLEDARIILEPLYREVVDDLERRMLTTESMDRAFEALNRPGLEEREPLEEALVAAIRHSMSSIAPRRRSIEQAVTCFVRAVREAGGDLDATSARIGPGELALRAVGLAEDKARDLAVGVAIGLLMAADAGAEAGLVSITEDAAFDAELAA